MIIITLLTNAQRRVWVSCSYKTSTNLVGKVYSNIQHGIIVGSIRRQIDCQLRKKKNKNKKQTNTNNKSPLCLITISISWLHMITTGWSKSHSGDEQQECSNNKWRTMDRVMTATLERGNGAIESRGQKIHCHIWSIVYW